ncbi:helix-turn-helix transcriptional regulator [Streptomyces hyaluromycini]|uniref:Helix-turn-helix transcriptional regulator n=1 Tax=Streptomyces hyaluromycini TaxID=1377993 RepID=A0ABV1WRK1_9ACTN
MGVIADSLQRAAAEHFTRPIPKTTAARLRFLIKSEHGSTSKVATRLGIHPRTVQRYLSGQLKQPKPALAARLAAEVGKDWQPRIRRRAAQQAATRTGLTVETRASFGYTAAPGTTDESRMRRITQRLPPDHAAHLLQAHATGADEQQLAQILAQGLQETYFKDGGRRALGLLVELHDIDYVDIAF